ncbi:MAG: ABC transporter substrate-binding protein [Eubacteriaceae bacterium]|nr:ABC transporter substrate-binding protein [Eubacteriaceae bacterium]
MLIDSSKSKPQKVFDFLHAHILPIIVGIVLISSMLSLIVIMTSNDEKKQENNSDIVYEDIDTIYFAMNNIKSLNPLSSKDEDTYYISQIVYNSLFTLDDTLNIKGDLVSKYTANPENGSVKLTLKKAKFSDGTSLSAYDVDYTIDVIKGLESSSPYFRYVDKIDYVEVLDSRTLKITFKNKYDAALDNLVFPIVSRESYESGTSGVPGTGPYCYGVYDRQRTLTLKPNKHYNGEKAKGKIVFKYVKNKDAVVGLITADMITAYMNKESDADAIAEDRDLQYTPVVSSEAEYLGFNMKNSLLADKKMRQAIAYGIDSDSIINENYGGTAVTADSIYFPGFMGTSAEGNRYAVDQRKSAALLEELGYKETNGEGYLVDEKGKVIEFSILVNSDNSGRCDSAASIADHLSKVGLKIKVEKLPWKKYLKALKQNKYDLYLGGYTFDKQFNLKSLFDKSNIRGYNNGDVQSYLKKMEMTLGAKKLTKYFEEFDQLLAEEVPYYCICYKTYGFTSVEHFTCQIQPTFFDIYRGCEEWKWQKAVSVESDNSEDNTE